MLKDIAVLLPMPSVEEPETTARIFEQPWQAEAFAATVALHRRGVFEWSEWVSVFSGVIAERLQLPGEDANTAYYRQWLVALERLLADRRIVDAAAVDRAQEDWRRSYLNTPHGSPVVFQRDLPEADLHACGHHERHPRDDCAASGASHGHTHVHGHGHAAGRAVSPVAVSRAGVRP